MTKIHKVLDLCSGIGGMHLGFERTGKYKVIAWCEINDQARSVYERNFPNLQNWTDITKIDENEVPDIDLIAAGIPCQAFSNAGYRKGFDDARGTIVYDVLRITKAKKPRYVVIENVPGLITHDKGRTISTMTKLFEGLGYSVMIRKMFSDDFVPQHRERVFIICEKDGQLLQSPWDRVPNPDNRLLRDILESEDDIPDRYYLKFDQVKKIFNGKNKTSNAKMNSNGVNIVGNGYFSYLPVHEDGNSGTLNALHDSKKVVTRRSIKQLDNDGFVQAQALQEDGISYSLQASGGGGNTTKIITERKIKMPNGNKYDSDKTCNSDGLSPSLRVGGDTSKTLVSFDPKDLPKLPSIGKPDTYIAVFGDKERGSIVGYDSKGYLTTYWIRRLTPTEGCRLQGFPDKWTAKGLDDKPISDSAQHRLIGNAVTVPVIEYIGNVLNWN